MVEACFKRQYATVFLLAAILFAGCRMQNNPSPEARKLWEEHKEEAHSAAYHWLSRSHYGTDPWFAGNASFVHENDKLVALRYHSAFVAGRNKWDSLKEYEKHMHATHVIQYSLETKEWSLVYSPNGGSPLHAINPLLVTKITIESPDRTGTIKNRDVIEALFKAMCEADKDPMLYDTPQDTTYRFYYSHDIISEFEGSGSLFTLKGQQYNDRTGRLELLIQAATKEKQ